MFKVRSITPLTMAGMLLLVSACGKHKKRHYDAAVDSATSDAATAEAGQCQGGLTDSGVCSGSVQLTADFCDRARLTVTPLQAVLGQEISLTVRAKDGDSEGLTVGWSAEPDGTFGENAQTDTTYRCDSLGRKSIHMTSIDERGCESAADVDVSCASAR